jgi:hypothetical protein
MEGKFRKKGGDNISKVFKIVTIAIVITVILILAVAGTTFAGPGPAPNSGDGVPDGPGWPDGTIPNGPNVEARSGSEPMGPIGSCFRDGSCQE